MYLSIMRNFTQIRNKYSIKNVSINAAKSFPLTPVLFLNLLMRETGL